MRFFAEDLLSALASSLEADTQRRERVWEEARQQLINSVLGNLRDFPRCLFEHEELPTHKPKRGQRIALFPLGEYRYVWLNIMSGRTTLYLGEGGDLYEYGPAHISSGDINPTDDNTMSLRVIKVDELTYGDLMLARDLLRQVWLV